MPLKSDTKQIIGMTALAALAIVLMWLYSRSDLYPDITGRWHSIANVSDIRMEIDIRRQTSNGWFSGYAKMANHKSYPVLGKIDLLGRIRFVEKIEGLFTFDGRIERYGLITGKLQDGKSVVLVKKFKSRPIKKGTVVL